MPNQTYLPNLFAFNTLLVFEYSYLFQIPIITMFSMSMVIFFGMTLFSIVITINNGRKFKFEEEAKF